MRRSIRLAVVLWAISSPAGAGTGATVDELRWLAGCWTHRGGEPGSGEQWTSPAGGTMLGTGRTVRGGETVGYEFLMIREAAEGGLEYVAQPSGQETTVFRLEVRDSRRVVFANPEHDFPQRVIYELRSDGTLGARIEGTVAGEDRAIDFPMERADCPGPPHPLR